MRIINDAEFLQKKKSDTIFILGSGYSINSISKRNWDIIKKHDSIGFNWFCMHDFEPSFYLIREQANIPTRKGKNETIRNFIARINRYTSTIGIISDVSDHSSRAHPYSKDERIEMECIILKDDKNKKRSRRLTRYMDINPTKYGLIHGSCTLYNVLHLVKWMGYAKIVFVGIDLYDSRYFWLGENETRHTVKKKSKSYKNKHAVLDDVFRLINKFKKFNIPMFTANPKSMLKRIIPIINIDEVDKV